MLEPAMRQPVIDQTQIGINGVALLSPLTGTGQYTFHLVREMQQLLQPAPWIFYGSSWHREIRSAALPGANIIKKIFKRIIPQPYRVSRFMMQRHFSSGARDRGIQLYHEPNFMAFRYRGPTVVTIHDLSWIRYPDTQPPQRVRFMNDLMPDIVRRADHILTDSEFIRQEVIGHYGVARERVTSVSLGVTPDFQPRDGAACQRVLAMHGLRFGGYLLAVGTLEPRKNLGTAINAYSRLPQSVRRRFPLVIAGMGGWQMSGFSRQLHLMVERGEVILTGYVPQADLPLLYAGARMLVYPSLYEGFGLPPLEAMASGVPVIASNRASLPEVVADAGILTEPMDDVLIAQHMHSLIDDDQLHGRLMSAGRLHSQQFTWCKCAVETLSVYQKTLAEDRHSAGTDGASGAAA